jgi:hypothetical protein
MAGYSGRRRRIRASAATRACGAFFRLTLSRSPHRGVRPIWPARSRRRSSLLQQLHDVHRHAPGQAERERLHAWRPRRRLGPPMRSAPPTLLWGRRYAWRLPATPGPPEGVSVLAGRGPWSAAPRRAAGTRPERFHAASSVPVIRVAPRHHRRICAPGVCRPGHPYSPRQRAERGHERRTRSRRAEAGPGRAVPARLRQAAPTPASRAPGVCRPGHPFSPRQRAERGHDFVK